MVTIGVHGLGGLFLQAVGLVEDSASYRSFNTYFSNNGGHIIANKKDVDACLLHIRDKWKNQWFSFCFPTVSTGKVMKKFKTLNNKKAVGCDGIPVKLIKIAASSLVTSLTDLINKSISTSVFQGDLKL